MAKNREVSQLGSFINVNDTTGVIGIANSVGINTATAPSGTYALDVNGVINSNTDIQINGVSVTAGSGGGGASIDDATALAIALG